MSVAGYVRATHAAPTLAVTTVITLTAWSLGWRGIALAGVAAAVFVGQCSIGWSNDAFDADLDARAERSAKPTVAGLVSARSLWRAAIIALGLSAALSWSVAGWVGGSFHVVAVAMAWAYNTVLSRTAWSWLPYAVSFGCVPPFLTYGLTATPPPAWLVAIYPIVGVSAHLANALPDLESDQAAGVGGIAVRLGAQRAALICWVLLGIGSTILTVVALPTSGLLALVVAGGYLAALVYGTRSRSKAAMFNAIMVAVLLDVAVLVVTAAMS